MLSETKELCPRGKGHFNKVSKSKIAHRDPNRGTVGQFLEYPLEGANEQDIYWSHHSRTQSSVGKLSVDGETHTGLFLLRGGLFK